MVDGVQPHRPRADDAHLGAAVQARDPGRVAAQELGREVPQRAQHTRLDEVDLPPQVVLAGLDLGRVRVAVAGRTALEHVGDEHVRAGQADLPQQLLQQLAGRAHERQALLVLVRARRLADEHQVGVGVARPEDHRRARRGQLRALLAPAGLLVDGLQRLAPVGGGLHGPNLDQAVERIGPLTPHFRGAADPGRDESGGPAASGRAGGTAWPRRRAIRGRWSAAAVSRLRARARRRGAGTGHRPRTRPGPRTGAPPRSAPPPG